jgi:hypothetical protein
MITYDITQPWKTLDPWQIEYINTSPEQDCMLLKGRQCGGTAAMAIKCVELCAHYFKKDQNILICSITEKQAYRLLAKALVYAKMKYPKLLIQKGEDRPTKHIIKFTTGAGIYSYAAGETGGGLRGDTIKKLMVDEGSRMTDEFFIATTPMLSVAKGSMDIASTPFGKKDKEGNEKFFYKCSIDDHYKKFYVSAEDCPRHSKEFLQREKDRMTKLQYAQEYLAMFLDNLIQFFPNNLIKEICIIPRNGGGVHSTGPSNSYFLGVDIARMGEDDSTFEILDGTNKENIFQVESIVTQKTLTTQTTKKIINLNSQYDFNKIGVDDGGIGVGVFDQLLETDEVKRKVVALNNATRSIDTDEKQKKLLKEDMYNNLLRLMERKEIKLFKEDEVIASLTSIQYEYNDQGKMIIWGSNAHITEGLIRAAHLIKDKSLKPCII